MSNEFTSPNDFFGNRPARPTHDDFWKLSDIILRLDGAMTERARQGQSVPEVVAERAGQIGDPYSISYMATQRAMKLYGVETLGQLKDNIDDVNRAAVIYMEALIVGAQLQQTRTDAETEEP